MRRFILIAAFVALAPVVYAQSNIGTMGGPSAPPDQMGGMNRGGGPATGSMTEQSGAENCGTPDEPKACPPMPRRNLKTYPRNR